MLTSKGEDVLYEFTVEPEMSDRLDKVIATNVSELTRSSAENHIKNGLVELWLDGKKMENFTKSTLVTEGTKIIIHSFELVPLDVLPEKMNLDIVFEDEDLIIVNKPQGLVVHPAYGSESNTLVNGLLYHIQANNAKLSHINGVIRPGIVHRIDKDTAGLLVIAKSDLAHQSLSEQLANHSMVREYVAIVYGHFQKNEGEIDASLGRDPKDRKKRAILREDRGGKRAVTKFSVLGEIGPYSLVSLRLLTGRTHQIRVHMAHIGHSLVGDQVYSKHKSEFEGQLLCAKRLGFVHPRTKKYMEWEISLPQIMQGLIERYDFIKRA